MVICNVSSFFIASVNILVPVGFIWWEHDKTASTKKQIKKKKQKLYGWTLTFLVLES